MTEMREVSFEDWEQEQLQDPKVRAALEELEPAYQVARLRILGGLTQEQLAQMVGTRQSSIARLESGKTQPSVSFLRRVADALGAELEIKLVSRADRSAKTLISDETCDQPTGGEMSVQLDPRLLKDLQEFARRQSISLDQATAMLLSECLERERIRVYFETFTVHRQEWMYSEHKVDERQFTTTATLAEHVGVYQ